jgi:hypothetical protein
VQTWRQGLRVTAEKTNTPASKSKILTAKSRRERRRIRVMLSMRNAKDAPSISNLYTTIELAARQYYPAI